MRPLSELTLYKYRYLLSYSVLVLLTMGLLLLFVSTIPAGLSQAEQASALQSSQIVFDRTFLDKTDMIDLPYHLLQRASLELFGLSPFSVRLPSLLCGALSALFMLLILRRWLQENVAIAWGILLVTSSWFLMMGRSGTPEIMVVFWTSLIMLLATLVSQQSRYYQTSKAFSLLCVGLSFYTPLMAYLFIASGIAATVQPHLRYVVRYAEKASISVGLLLFLLILAPLGWHIWRDPIVIRELLAIPAVLPDPWIFIKDLWVALNNLLNPFNPSVGLIITPLVSIPTLALGLIGLVHTVRDAHSVRSYVLLLWLAVLIPVIGLNPAQLNILFVPLMLLGAIGTQAVFRFWYDLFPRNPYARVFGLLPIGLLLFSVVQFNYQRYFLAVPYAASSVQLYDPDPTLLHQTLSSKAYRDERVVVIAPLAQKELYQLNNAFAKNIEVMTPAQFTGPGNASSIIVAESVARQLAPEQRAQLPEGKVELLVSDRKEEALRFRIYSQ